MKKTITVSTLLLLLVFIFSSTFAYAADLKVADNTSATITGQYLKATHYNEGEALLSAKKMSDKELFDLGLSAEQVSDLRNFSLEDALLERAKLPVSTLHAYGYTDDQILLLKAYDGSPITEESEILALTSDCDGHFGIGNYSTSSISLTYTWTWSVVPLIKLQDSVAVAWQGVRKPDNLIFDLKVPAKMRDKVE